MNKCKWCDQEIFIINECNDNCECDRCKGFCAPLHYFKYLDRFGKFGEKMTERKIVDYCLTVCSQESHENGATIKIRFKGDETEYMPKSVDEHLNLSVRNLLKQGFTPLGVPSISFDNNGYMIISQAMVKYEEK